jgi:predicted RNase H-like HicB family nuclease
MRLNREDYVLERTTDGGYCAYLSYNMQCNAYGDTPEEAIEYLQENMDDYINEMYLVEDYV